MVVGSREAEKNERKRATNTGHRPALTQKDHRRRRRAFAGAVVLALCVANISDATRPSPVVPVPSSAFSPVVVSAEPNASIGPVLEPLLLPEPTSLPPRRQVEQVQQISRPTKPPAIKPADHRTSGVASWYCGHGSICTRGHPGGLYAAIRRDLLFLRGKTVTATSGSKSVKVTIIDCNCGPNANVIDLYSDAFARLAPLSRGRIPVTLRW